MRSDIERRDVFYDASTATLTVGERVVVLSDPADNERLLRTYLSLVAEQRTVPLGADIELRRDDIAVLAELLDLDDADLEADLRRILHLSEAEAADLHRRLRRHKLAAAAVGVGLLAAVPVGTVVAGADEGSPAVVEVRVSPDAIDRAVVVEAPDPFVPAPVAKSAPAPAEEPDVDVGYSVRYEQDPDFVPPEGVDIGSAMVIERNQP